MAQTITSKTIPVIRWAPHNGPQVEFHKNSSFECLFGGAKGPGKTESLLRESLYQVHIPSYRGILFRRTYPQLGEIIDRSFKYFLGMADANGTPLRPKYSDKDMHLKLPAWTFPSGAKIAFGSVQYEKDKYNYQGKEFQFQGFDQIEQFTETQYLYLIAQNRTSDPAVKCYIRATANPGGVGHAWVKSRFIDKLFDPENPKRVQTRYFQRINDEDIEVERTNPKGRSRAFVFSTLFDNPSLSPDYLKTLYQLPEQDQRAFIGGDWEVFAGQFFKMWRKMYHVIERPIEPGFRKFISLDYGYGAPSCAIWWQVDYDGNLHAYRELYKEGLTYEALAHRIKELTPADEHIDYCVADPAIWGDRIHHKEGFDGEAGAETMQKVWGGWSSLIKADNDRIVGWGRMRILLNPDKEGKVKMSFSSMCKNAIRTIPGLIHDEIKVEDLDSDGEDHAADSSRYAVMSRPVETERPKSKPTRGSLEEVDYHLEMTAQANKPRGIW